MFRLFRLALIMAVFAACSMAWAEDDFPSPPELQPDIDFWLSIFTRYASTEGVLHDSYALGVVYTRLDMPLSLSSRQRQRRITSARDRFKAILRKLANGKREQLSDEEARVLALWPDDVSNATLGRAAGNIRYQGGLADRFRAGLVRSGRWREYIEAEFSALGVPTALAALPHVESSYNPDARSRVGASGIWQFTRSTGRRFMRVDHVLDERNDPFAATRGAGRLLAYNYSITGNWPTAITAYNHGLAGVRRAMREFGDTAYVDILRNYRGRTFGFASRNFYVAFLAAMRVDQNPESYFPGIREESAEDYTLVRLRDYLAADDLVAYLDISANDLARHNRALQPTVWQGSKLLPKDFELKIPARYVTGSPNELLAGIPADQWASAQLPDLFHTIVRGDTLSQIAEEYDTSVSTLAALNNLDKRYRIRAGQQLRLPAAGPAPSGPAVVSSVSEAVEAEVIASVAAVPPDDMAVEEPAPTVLAGDQPGPAVEVPQTELLSDPSDYSVADDLTIEIQSFETLGHYADWLGIRTQRLRDINALRFGSSVALGQRIKLEFVDVDVTAFESRRIAYHRKRQDRFFREHAIVGVTRHVMQRGESVWVVSLREHGVPLWLFRQYNPELDLDKVQPGTVLNIPLLGS